MAREHGGIIVDGVQVASTNQCPHCGGHFQMVKGSGRIRHWCFACGQVTCGKAQCIHHVPMEAQLDHMEGKKTKYTDLILEQGILL